MKNTLATQPTNAEVAAKFKRNFFVSPQDGFVVCNLDDINETMNNLQKTLLFEIHHQMIVKPKRGDGDMPHWEGPYEIELAIVGEHIIDHYIYPSKSRSYHRENSDPVNIQFFLKRTVDLKIEQAAKEFCRTEGIKLRYLDSSFFVECVQLWLVSEETEGEEVNNTQANKDKLRDYVWRFIENMSASGDKYAKDISYKKERIVYYDDILIHNSHNDMSEMHENVPPELSYGALVENILKSNNNG